MSEEKFFSISGVACVAHTPETREKWRSIKGCKSDFGRQAILDYAQDLGFEYDKEEVNIGTVKKALNYALRKFQGVFGAKSHIIRKAIINY